MCVAHDGSNLNGVRRLALDFYVALFACNGSLRVVLVFLTLCDFFHDYFCIRGHYLVLLPADQHPLFDLRNQSALVWRLKHVGDAGAQKAERVSSFGLQLLQRDQQGISVIPPLLCVLDFGDVLSACGGNWNELRIDVNTWID